MRLPYNLSRFLKGGIKLVSLRHRLRVLLLGRVRTHYNSLDPCPKCGDLDQVEEGPSATAFQFATCHRCEHEYFA